ncbi:MAG TPA: MlaD family protein [Marmoricola sp.]|jgi:phospholipid/cholesterol/gamma-HCH transport system substrate-binding protein|nr:MlaD family protein [Marmoricola sp.]
MKLLDKKTSADFVKLMIFIVVTTMATGVLVVLIGNLTFQSSRQYKAVFSDVTGVFQGDDIRIAGVKVGSVQDVEIVDGNHALVTFDVADDATVTRSSTATVRYRNLVGQRYISITQGVGDLSQLPEGSTIPLSRTEPALDLTVLFNGFKPLFAALNPADVNKLSYELIKVFQGEGGNLEGLLRSTASVTSTLASRDQLVGEVIDNLNEVLVTLSGRDKELSELIVQLRDFVGGLTQDKDAILGSLDSISNLSEQTADLVTGVRPGLVRSIKELREVAGNLKAGREEIDRALQILPIKLTKIGRTAIYGSFFNFYLCEFHATVMLPDKLTQALPQQLPKGVEATYQLPKTGRCNLT